MPRDTITPEMVREFLRYDKHTWAQKFGYDWEYLDQTKELVDLMRGEAP